MVAGIPGVGISGIFYLLCVLLMPIIEVVNVLKKRSSKKRWKVVAVQFSFLCGIIGASWITGRFVIIIIQKFFAPLAGKSIHIFRLQPLFFSLTILCIVIAGLRIVNYFRNRKLSLLNKRKVF